MWGPLLVLQEKTRIPLAILSYVAACMLPGPEGPIVGLPLRAPRGRIGSLGRRALRSMVNMIAEDTPATIVFVEADVSHAVPWTKPDDLAFDADKLPWLYIFMAVLGGTGATWMSKAAMRERITSVIGKSQVFLIANILLIWWLLKFQSGIVLYVFSIWVGTFSVITVGQFWLLAQNLLDSRIARRLLPIIGVAAVIGGNGLQVRIGKADKVQRGAFLRQLRRAVGGQHRRHRVEHHRRGAGKLAVRSQL